MDQDLQQRIEEAKAAGYSDEEIAKALGTAPPPAQATMPNGINVPILSAEEKAQFNKSEQQTSSRNTGEQVATGATGAALGAAAVGVPAALYFGGKAILNPAAKGVVDFAQQGLNTANRGVDAMQGRTAIDAAREARMSNRPGFGGPVVPQPMPGVPTGGSVAPTPMPAANDPSMQSKVRAAAAQRITNLPKPGMLASAGKLLPGVGTALNAADAYSRFQEGDYLGAGIAGAGAVASPFPVAGTVIGAGTGAINAYRDYLKREEEKKRMMK